MQFRRESPLSSQRALFSRQPGHFSLPTEPRYLFRTFPFPKQISAAAGPKSWRNSSDLQRNVPHLHRCRARHPRKAGSVMSGVLLVDDHPIVLSACRQLLEASGASNILEAHDTEGAYQAFLDHRPEVVVIDLSLRGEELDGLALIERIRSEDPDAKILVFSMHAEPRIVTSAIEAGAAGYLLKDAAPDELPKAVEQVRLGKR